jgi:2-dehydropantoate 2-reductase
MRVGIIGMGAIGSAFAEGLRQITTVRTATRADVPPLGLADADVVLVAVKTYDTVSALQPLRGILRPNVPIVSLQNGIDQVTQITAALGSTRPIMLAPTTEAAARDASGVIRRTGRGVTTVGWVADRGGDFDLLAFIALLRKAGFETQGASPIEPHVWAKLVATAAISPITALAGKPNCYVAEHRAASALAVALAREAAAVAAAEGMTLPFEEAGAHALEVARVTGANRSSMLQDLERKRPLEIDAINGAILRRGRARGIPTPENARIIDEVRRFGAAAVRAAR